MTRILLAESDTGARLLLEGALSRRGFEVTVAESGAQALARAREHAFDVALLAVQLTPGPDGIELCRRLQPLVGSDGLAVVLLSQRTPTREEQELGYDAGCAAYVPRADAALLESIVQALARLKSARDEVHARSAGLEDQVRRLREELQHAEHGEERLRGARPASHGRHPPGLRPDGLLIVDDDGVVRFADRGALALLGSGIEGHNLGSLAPASGLEAFVRDTRAEPREGFQLELQSRSGRAARDLTVSVVPLVAPRSASGGTQRAVVLQDAMQRRLAHELQRLHDTGLARRVETAALDLCRRVLGPGALLGSSPAMTELRAGVARAAHAEDALLIEGPPGSGKTLTAHVVHYCGSRPGRALSFDCGARSPESCLVDLLGQVRSAQPGLPADRPGILHAAHHGTLILEEVGDLPIDAQQAILTLIADGAVMRRGAVRAEPLEVRVLATSSIDLEERVDQGRFVPALYQCLRARSLSLPPLADRIEDLPILIQSFLQRWSRVPHQQIFDAVQSVFESYSWPGNVRELESAIERGCQQALDGPLDVHHLPPALRAHAEQARSAVLVPSRRRERLGQTASMDRLALASESGDDHPVSLKNFEKMALVKALQLTQGDKLAAARHLKIGKSTLYRKLQEHGLR